MKKVLTIILIFISSYSFSAPRYWVGGGATTNWNATGNTNWSATSGGSNNASVPTSSDDIIFDGAGSGNGASNMSQNIAVLSITFTSGYTNTVTIAAGGRQLTVAGNFTDNIAHNWVVNTSGSLILSTTCTITSGGKTFPGDVNFQLLGTKTLLGNWTILGQLSFNGTNTIFNRTTTETMSCNGFNINGGSTIAGSTEIILTGGTLLGGSTMIQNNITIAGNVNVSGSVLISSVLTYSSGVVTTTGGIITFGSGATVNTNGINWNSVVFSGGTVTLTSLLTATTITLSPSVQVTFAGTSGFTVGTLLSQSQGSLTYTFKNGITYVVTTALSAFTSRTGSIILFTSDHATLKAILTLQQGATCNVLANFTRINAGSGRTIRSFNGTITDCINVVPFNDVGTNSAAFAQ